MPRLNHHIPPDFHPHQSSRTFTPLSSTDSRPSNSVTDPSTAIAQSTSILAPPAHSTLPSESAAASSLSYAGIPTSSLDITTPIPSAAETSTQLPMSGVTSTPSRQISSITLVAIILGVLAGVLALCLTWCVVKRRRARHEVNQGVTHPPDVVVSMQDRIPVSFPVPRETGVTSHASSAITCEWPTNRVQEVDAGSVHPSAYLNVYDHDIAASQPLPPAYEDLLPRGPVGSESDNEYIVSMDFQSNGSGNLGAAACTHNRAAVNNDVLHQAVDSGGKRNYER